MRLIRVWLALLSACAVISSSRADELPTDKINKRVELAALTDAAGKPVPLAPAADVKATVVVFLSFDCPVSNSYAAPLTELAAAYAAKGVRLVGVVAEEPSAALAKQVTDFKLGFPVVADPKLDAAAALRATTVPEAFVLDHNGVLRYRGRIDDAYSARLKRNAAVTSHDLKDALDALLAGKDVATPVTRPVGCPVGPKTPAAKPGADTSVTYYKDVLPVLQSNCQGCHRPGQVGPFSLLTYRQAVNWADDIKEYTHARKMPPWKPVGGPGYTNERAMSDKDIATLAKWVDAGCPEGNKADAPPAKTFGDGWANGPPDLVLTVPEDFHVGPAGKDLFRCFVLPTGLTEDKYVVGYEIKPGNPRVVHHTLNFFDTTGKARELAEQEAKRKKKGGEEDRGPGYSVAMGIGFTPAFNPAQPSKVPPIGMIGGWAPGQLPSQLPEGTGYLLPKGSDIIIQTHYHRTGKPEVDRVSVGLYFAKKPVAKPFQTIGVSPPMPNGRQLIGLEKPTFLIPAGATNHVITGAVELQHDATIYSVIPHMHLLGRKIKVTVTPLDGPPVVLVDIPDWDYNWQETYWLKTPIAAKAGTRIEVEGVYDNSLANPNNPSNPPKEVRFGEQTTNEMLFGFVGVTPVGEGRVRVIRLAGGAKK
jgi:hypothetical protein